MPLHVASVLLIIAVNSAVLSAALACVGVDTPVLLGEKGLLIRR